MNFTLIKRIEVVTFWLLGLAFFVAAIANFVDGKMTYGYLGMFNALGVLPPLKSPLPVKLLALTVAGLLLFI